MKLKHTSSLLEGEIQRIRITEKRGLSDADIPRVLQLCLQMVSDEPARIQLAGKKKNADDHCAKWQPCPERMEV